MIKKILMMVAVAALAFGAWAEEVATADSDQAGQFRTYSFDMMIYDISLEHANLTGAATCYLVDGSSNLILAYGAAGEWDKGDVPPDNQNMVVLNHNIAHNTQGTITIGGQELTYATYGHTMIQTESKIQNIFRDANGNQLNATKWGENPDGAVSKDVQFTIGFTTDDKAVQDALAKATKAGNNNTLYGILCDPGDETHSAYYQVFDSVSLQGAPEAARAYTSGIYGAVPEPTSGLLVLMGLAGLALRRRKVA